MISLINRQVSVVFTKTHLALCGLVLSFPILAFTMYGEAAYSSGLVAATGSQAIAFSKEAQLESSVGTNSPQTIAFSKEAQLESSVGPNSPQTIAFSKEAQLESSVGPNSPQAIAFSKEAQLESSVGTNSSQAVVKLKDGAVIPGSSSVPFPCDDALDREECIER